MGLLDNLFKKNKEEADCMKILDLLDSMLDDETDEKEKETFHNHIEKCMPCYERFNLDKSIKELIKTRCNSAKVPEGLVDSIKLQINQSDIN